MQSGLSHSHGTLHPPPAGRDRRVPKASLWLFSCVQQGFTALLSVVYHFIFKKLTEHMSLFNVLAGRSYYLQQCIIKHILK